MGAPSKDRTHHLTKQERLLEIVGDPTIVTLIDMRQRLADLFKGTSYKGPYKHVTHKEAFLNRQTKRLEKERARYADGTPIVTELGEKS